MDISNDYMACGEILKLHSTSQKTNPYLLKCIRCEDIFVLLEPFVVHVEDNCEQIEQHIKKEYLDVGQPHERVSNDSERDHVSQNCKRQQNPDTCTNVVDDALTTEGKSAMDMVDPLILIKEEPFQDDGTSLLEEADIHLHDDSEPALKDAEEGDSEHSLGEDVDIIEDTIHEFQVENSESDNESDKEKDPLILMKEEPFQDDGTSLLEEADIRLHDDSEPALKDADEGDSEHSLSEDVDGIEDTIHEFQVENNESDNESDEEKCNNYQVNKVESTSIFNNNFMQSQANVKALIEAYKKQTPLWNKRTPIRHKQHRLECLEKVTQELNEQLKTDLKWSQVSALIVHLCRKYREELKLLKENQEKNIKYKSSWYFQHLHFLKPFMENNYIAKLDPELPALLPDQIIEIFHIYEGIPNLWNTNIIEHRCKNKRREAETEMLKALENNLNMKISVECLNKYLHNIHYYFGQGKRNKLKNDDNIIEEYYVYYKHANFLYDHVGPFKCPQCDQQFQSPFRFKLHKSQHDGTMPFSCSQCGKGISKMLAYDFHARRHMEDFEDVCKECGRQFLHANALKIHMRNHTGAKPYCCEICGNSFRHIQSFQCHKRKHEKRYLHTCEICSKGFYTKAKMNDHMKTHTNVRDCICKTCGKAFKTINSLRTHEAIHRDVRKYVCTICGKAFKITNGLTQHMKTHGSKLGEEKTTVLKY